MTDNAEEKNNFPGNDVDSRNGGVMEMAEVYFYVHNAAVGNAVDCGLKLSEWHCGEAYINGSYKKYILTLLNPRDNMELYLSREHTCLKLNVSNNYCYVAEGGLRIAGRKHPLLMEMYEKSIIPVEEYVFGRYRLPECLVVSTVIGGNIFVLDKRKDSPVLYNSSRELYLSNTIEAFREKYDDFNDTLLYSFYELYANQYGIEKIPDEDSGLTVFIDRKTGKFVILEKPANKDWFAGGADG